MARYRSRRSSRRSASQSAASLLALALPAPIQRVADTRLGPLLMLVGIPSMLVAGLLQINWTNGLPSVAIDPQAATKAIAGVEQQFNNFERQGGLQDFGQTATDFFHDLSNASQGYIPPTGYGQNYPKTQQPAPARVPTASFPSTQPQSAATQRDYRYTTSQPNGYSQQPTYSQQPNYSPNQTYAQEPTYTQPNYTQPNYTQHGASPSDTRNLTQQQLYQQQQYAYQQQQLHDQQLRDQQYRQWLAQQQSSGAQQNLSTGYQQQLDAYGRPVSTGYAQPANSYAQPTTQYGQQNYNQGLAPNANTNGRY